MGLVLLGHSVAQEVIYCLLTTALWVQVPYQFCGTRAGSLSLLQFSLATNHSTNTLSSGAGTVDTVEPALSVDLISPHSCNHFSM